MSLNCEGLWHDRAVPRKRSAIISAGCILAGIAIFVFWPEEKEPEYNGKKLSEWLAVQREQPEEVTRAVRAIGTNGLPFLVKWAEFQIPNWQISILRVYTKLPGQMQSGSVATWMGWNERTMRAYSTRFAFRVLGADGASVVPELSRFIKNPRNRSPADAATALAYAGGRDALPILLAIVQDKTSPARRWAVVAALKSVSYRGTEMEKAVVALIACLQDNDPIFASFAASALGEIAMKPELSVPALSNACHASDYRLRNKAIQALGGFGPDAASALDVVTNAFNDPDQHIRNCATNAFKKIVPVNYNIQ